MTGSDTHVVWIGVGTLIVLLVVFRGIQKQARRTRHTRVAAAADADAVVAARHLTALELTDPCVAFPASLRWTSSDQHLIRRDHKRRHGAVARGWHGRSDDGTPFAVYHGDGHFWDQWGSDYQYLVKVQVVRVLVPQPDGSPVELVVAPIGDWMGIKRSRLKLVDVGAGLVGHEIRRSARTDERRASSLFIPECLSWLSTLDKSIRFEYFGGSLEGVRHAPEDKPLPALDPLIDATCRMARFLRETANQ